MILKITKSVAFRFSSAIKRIIVKLFFLCNDCRNLFFEHYEYKTLCQILESIQVDLIVDVGANRGQFAKAVFRGGYSGKLISFEPLGEEFEILEKVSRDNPRWFVAERCAIGDRDGEACLNVSKYPASSSILPMHCNHTDGWPGTEYVSTQQVKINKLDSLQETMFSKFSRPFLKVDIQGFERQVLDGAEYFLSSVVGVHLEVSLDTLYEGSPHIDEMISYLYLKGFVAWNIFPVFSSKNRMRLYAANIVFVRKVGS